MKLVQSHWYNFGFFIVFFISIIFLKININQYPFWDDESSVSWFASNYNKYGKIIGYDGNNAFFYRNGALLNEKMEYNNPPLDIYYIALIQRMFGQGPAIERFAFVFIGILSLGLFCLFLKSFIQNKTHQLISFTLFALSINFILFSKNCRYYALTLFLALVLMYCILIIQKIKNLKIIAILIYGLASYLLFLSHYTQGIFWIIASTFFYLRISNLSFLDWLKSNRQFLIVNTILFLSTIWFIYTHRVWDRPDLSLDYSWVKRIGLLSIWLIHDLNRYLLVPLIFIPIGLILHIKNRNFFSNEIKALILTTLVFLFLSIVLSPQNVKNSGSFDIRYIYSILPFLFTITGYFLVKIIDWNYKIGVVVSIIYIFSSIFFFIPFSTPLQIPLVNYLNEKGSSYKSASSEILKYLDTIVPVRTLATFPSYFNTQVLDYYSPKFKITHTLDSSSHLSHTTIIDTLKLSFAKDQNLQPDLVIIAGDHKKEAIEHGIKLHKYPYCDTLDVYGGFDVEIYRPELPWHSFKTIENYNKKTEDVYIYRKN
jgi:hypothetical protein